MRTGAHEEGSLTRFWFVGSLCLGFAWGESGHGEDLYFRNYTGVDKNLTALIPLDRPDLATGYQSPLGYRMALL